MQSKRLLASWETGYRFNSGFDVLNCLVEETVARIVPWPKDASDHSMFVFVDRHSAVSVRAALVIAEMLKEDPLAHFEAVVQQAQAEVEKQLEVERVAALQRES